MLCSLAGPCDGLRMAVLDGVSHLRTAEPYGESRILESNAAHRPQPDRLSMCHRHTVQGMRFKTAIYVFDGLAEDPLKVLLEGYRRP